MKVRIPARILLLGAAAGSMLAAPLATPASALTPSVVCSKLTSTTTISGSNGTTASTLSVCTPTALKAGGTSKVTVPVSKLTGNVTSKMTWKNGQGTTTVTEHYATTKSKGKCPAGTLYHAVVTGKTGASTGAAVNVIKKGEPITASVCAKSVNGKYVSTLEPGTKFKL